MSQVADEQLWKRIKEKWHRGDKGGEAGKWNARKAQLAVKEYKASGGTYLTSKPAKDNSLVKWTREDWGYVGDGPRYLPKSVRDSLTPAEKRATNARKRRGGAKASYSPKIARKVRNA